MSSRDLAVMGSKTAESASSASEEDTEAAEGAGTDEDPLHEEHEPLEESIYGWAVSMVVRDVVWLSEGTAVPAHRVARVLNSIFLILLTNSLQAFLLLFVSRLLTAPAVLNIRKTYGKYEALMYPNHTTLTVNGFDRGIPGFRVEENFMKMDLEEQRGICQVPLSHAWYLISILFIWTLTCQIEMRAIFETAVRLLWRTPTVPSTQDVTKPDEGQDHLVKVEGLTLVMKTIIGVFVLIPRTVMLLLLNYLGCRWLTATLGLGDVLLNGLALEFLVLLKELLYNVCISHRNRVDTQRLLVKPLRDVNKATFCTFFDAQVWGVISIAWALYYVYRFQMVLPDYRLDLRDMRGKYLPKGPWF
uniref:Uncharacterized protein n=1 Tax=Alexandrium monilatum TaxID=311494 RepID=A0A7S4VQN7_9DINO